MPQEITVRKAALADLHAIASLFEKVILNMQRQGIDQWDEIYPTYEIHKNDIKEGSLYLCLFEGTIAAAFTLNYDCDKAYEDGHWQSQGPFCVVHRLCVNPGFQNRGLGTQVMQAAEAAAREMGFEAIRLDTFSKNPSALRLYRKLGYTEAGVVTFRKGLFILFEKTL